MKHIILVITILIVFLGATGPALAVTPVIKANNSDGPVTINTSTELSLSISLDASTTAGQNSDWWLLLNTPSGAWYNFDLSSGWLPGMDASYQGPLSNLGDFSVSIPGLFTGTNTFYFGVDTLMNGEIDASDGQIFYDSVVVNGQSAGTPSNWIPYNPDVYANTCTNPTLPFSVSPMDSEGLGYIEPMGKMAFSHVTPVDHTYFKHSKIKEYEQNNGQGDWVPPFDVYAPGDGHITEISAFPNFGAPPGGYSGILENYRMIIWHPCNISTIFIHLGEIDSKILALTGPIPEGAHWFASQATPPVAVKAGQVIGKVGASGIDFSVHDANVTLNGFVTPSNYNGEAWKVHTVDPFNYFQEPAKSFLLGKNLRKVKPYGGKIDYDIDGRIVGNWFLDGTGDYGNSGTLKMTNYWDGHLTLAYDYIDPSVILISMPNLDISNSQCSRCWGAYGVKGNAPDPATIGVSDGMIKYELIDRETYALNPNIDPGTLTVFGVFVAQMIDSRTIKVETFLNQTASQVTGFTDAAKLYKR